jgi:hypothetical protein
VGGGGAHTISPFSSELLRQYPARVSTDGGAAHGYGRRCDEQQQHQRCQPRQRRAGRSGCARGHLASCHAFHPRVPRNIELDAFVPSPGLPVSLLPGSPWSCPVLANAPARRTCAQGCGSGRTCVAPLCLPTLLTCFGSHLPCATHRLSDELCSAERQRVKGLGFRLCSAEKQRV